MLKITSEYLNKSDENYRLFEELNKQDKYIDWQITILFYSLLCYIKAYFYEANEHIAEQMNSHQTMQMLICQDKRTKRLGVFDLYYPIYCYSRDARYKYNKTKKFHIDDSLTKYSKIKSLLALNTNKY